MDFQIALDATVPRRAGLERELRERIRSRRLAPGTRLPASRVLAGELGVSRGVVVDAYAQLVAEGYLVARQGSGTEVADTVTSRQRATSPRPAPSPPVRHDLRSGLPDLACFPRSAWQAATVRALRELPDPWLGYGRPRGLSRLRVALADHLGRVRGAVADPHHVVICAGLTHGLTVLWAALRERGARRIAVEDPAWSGQPATVARAGLQPVPVAVDAQGLVVSELDSLDVDAVVLAPAHQYPTGVVMAPERRVALIEWARRRAALIVEDDYDAEYQYDGEPMAALQGLAPECVVYAGTASKTLAPGLRIGWLLVPDHLLEAVTAEHEAIMARPSVLEQAALAIMLERGELERHLRHTRRRYRARRDALVAALAEALPQARVGGAAAGLHLIAWLPAGADELAIAARSARRGVAIDTLHGDCAVVAPVAPALVLGYASLAEPALAHAARELAAAVLEG